VNVLSTLNLAGSATASAHILSVPPNVSSYNAPSAPSKSPLPFGVQADAPVKPLWQLIVELLPTRCPETEWYNLKDIAPHLGIKPHALEKHAGDLWPNHEGHYRLNFSQAVSLIRRVCYAGKKLPTREQLELKMAAANEARRVLDQAPEKAVPDAE
jgi:hypothetical protein